MMYHPIKFGCKKISSSVDMVETVIFDHISPNCGLDLENSKPIFSHDTLAHDAASPYQVQLQKIQHLRRDHSDEDSLKFELSDVTLTLNTTKQSDIFKSLCHQTKFACKWTSCSVDIVESHNLTI